jgi:DNA repair photolyase
LETQGWLFPGDEGKPTRCDAAGSAPLGEERGISWFDLPCRSVLNRCTTDRMPFEWTINPYRGCEFGCAYCYARYSHEFLGLENWRDFQDRIFVKRRAPEILPRELTRARLDGKAIAIGTVTDPYQPAERKFRVTRRLLESLSRARGLRVSITTKSGLVTRDLDLLRELASRNRLSIHISLITLDRSLARFLEPRAPTPRRRLATLRALVSAGLSAGIFVMPVLPDLTDRGDDLDALVREAAAAGAGHLAAQYLFLRGSSREGFLARLAEEFPDFARRYAVLYRNGAYLSRARRDRLARWIDTLRNRYGIGSLDRVTSPPARAGSAPPGVFRASPGSRGRALRPAPREAASPGSRQPL